MKTKSHRRTFLKQSAALQGGFLILGQRPQSLRAAESGAVPSGETKPTDDDLTIPVNPQQVMAVLADIDRSGDPSIIEAVFTRWGAQCFHSNAGLEKFAGQQRENFQAYVDSINSNGSRYWEKLDYDPAGGVIHVTSRKFAKCVCAYAQSPRAPKALCTHCCKAFQAELFKAMTGREVAVQIDESILLGGERCRTTVRLLGHETPAERGAK